MSTKRTITLFFTLSILFFIDSFILANTSTNSELNVNPVRNINKRKLIDKSKFGIKTITSNNSKKLQNKMIYLHNDETKIKPNNDSNTPNKKLN
jgi:hypothetical protein